MSSFRHLTEQISALHKDLLAFQTRTEQRFDRIDGKFDKIDGRLGRMHGRFDRIGSQLRQLREDLPGIVRRAIRKVERENRRKSSK